MTQTEKIEWLACAESPIHFTNYCQIYDANSKAWIPFGLWPAQARTLKTIQDNALTIILKARQLGLTWLCLAYALWQAAFHPKAEVLLFSRRDDEAMYLLSDDRLKGMYNRLPEWARAREVTTDNGHEFGLSNGSMIRAFPTSAGDSYTATLAIVDEADLIPNFNRLMRGVKPTIDAGGHMILLSRADKTQPQSEFKNTYRAAKLGQSPWKSVFLPWYVHPARDNAWYETQKADIFSRTSALDDLHEQYPATDTEALAPRTLDKRIPAPWIEACYVPMVPVKDLNAPAIDQLIIYRPPQPGRRYVAGLDPAEGNPTSDDSAMTFLDALTGEECAMLSGKFQPAVFASHANTIGMYYNAADLMVERNNHGHAVLLWLEEYSMLYRLEGHDGKPGWNSSSLGKTLMYDALADAFRDEDTTLHSLKSYTQIASIEGSSLRAPEGENDDCADSYALANVGRAGAQVIVPGFAAGKVKGWQA